jgi:nicotinamide mononucleotide transporter
MFEILAVIFGLLQGITVALNKRYNWIFYIIQMVFMCIFSYTNHLYGDTFNSFVYIFFGIYGWLSWGSPESKITYLNKNQRIFILLTIFLGYIILRTYLQGTNDPLPQIDSFSTVTSIIATVLMICRKVETWILWFVNDIVYVVQYWMLPDQAFYLMFLNIIWTGLAVYSYIKWVKITNNEENIHSIKISI